MVLVFSSKEWADKHQNHPMRKVLVFSSKEWADKHQNHPMRKVLVFCSKGEACQHEVNEKNDIKNHSFYLKHTISWG